MQKHKKTLVITTGGTIESFYNPEIFTPANVPLEKPSIIPAAMEKLGLGEDCDFYHLCMEDSKRVFPDHMKHIAAYLAEHNDEYDKVMIVHGTDTIAIHGRLLKSYLQQYDVTGKSIIFAAAMTPLRDKDKNWREHSDGWNHLQLAFDALQKEQPGVLFTLYGDLKKPEEWDKFVKTEKRTLNGKPETIVTESGLAPRDTQHDGPLFVPGR